MRLFEPMTAAPVAGVQIVVSEHHVERVQHSRSPARAKRRAKKGYRPHFVTRPRCDALVVPMAPGRNVLLMHPTMARALAAAVRRGA
jgi:hypothetical protein